MSRNFSHDYCCKLNFVATIRFATFTGLTTSGRAELLDSIFLPFMVLGFATLLAAHVSDCYYFLFSLDARKQCPRPTKSPQPTKPDCATQ